MGFRHALIGLISLCLCSVGHVSAGDEFVLISDQQAVRKFSLDGEYLGDFLPSTSPWSQLPSHMTVGPDGNVYLANYGGGVEVFTLDGTHVRTIQSGAEMGGPVTVAFQNRVLVVAAYDSNRVLRYDVTNNDALLPDLVTLTGELRAPHTLLFRDDGDILLTTGGTNSQIARFDADGAYLGAFATDSLRNPLQVVATDDGQRLIVSNYGVINPGVHVYDADTGDLLGLFAPDAAQRADGIHILPDGSVLIAYHFANLVHRYSQDGTLLGVFADSSESLALPNGILYVPAPATSGLGMVAAFVLARRRRR